MSDEEKKRKPSVPITPERIIQIKRLREDGLFQHQIAAIIGCNQGRISEVLAGKREGIG
jgi:predicted XRE-type DNA-binding protein